jgi:hypothetical protein
MFIAGSVFKIPHPFRGYMLGTLHMSLLRSEEGLSNYPLYKHVTPPE